jgi:hypothetical protein
VHTGKAVNNRNFNNLPPLNQNSAGN